jgi:poly(3-hydroxybutyrate) depolymerase
VLLTDARTNAVLAGEMASGMASWPTSSSNSHYAANLAVMQSLMAMPEVDSSRGVYLLGYSNGGFYAYLLACTIGNQLAAIVVAAGLKEVQPSCPYRSACRQQSTQPPKPLPAG